MYGLLQLHQILRLHEIIKCLEMEVLHQCDYIPNVFDKIQIEKSQIWTLLKHSIANLAGRRNWTSAELIGVKFSKKNPSCSQIWSCLLPTYTAEQIYLIHLIHLKCHPCSQLAYMYAKTTIINVLDCGRLIWITCTSGPHPFFKYMVDIIHHLVILDVIYFIIHLTNGCELKFTLTDNLICLWCWGMY